MNKALDYEEFKKQYERDENFRLEVLVMSLMSEVKMLTVINRGEQQSSVENKKSVQNSIKELCTDISNLSSEI